MRTIVLGATGLVGRTMLGLLAQRPWQTGVPRALASPRSAGVGVPYGDDSLVCQAVDADAWEAADIALFSAGAKASRRWAPVAVAAGLRVIDNSSAWRMDPTVPLVVPEINGASVGAPGPGIIANPNCSTIQIAMAVAPLDRAFGVREVHVTTLQAVSGAGQTAVAELARQSRGETPEPDIFPRPMAGNVIPAVGAVDAAGDYDEETKVVHELRKILGRDTDLAVTCTATRVPVFHGHSAALRVVCEGEVTVEAAAAALAAWPGVEVARDPQDYHTPLEIAGRTAVHVGRIRRDPNRRDALLCWVVADNLLKGAAWNAVQIADRLAAQAGGGAS